MPNFLALGDTLAKCLLFLLPSRISARIRQNISPKTVYSLHSGKTKCDEPRMTLFEGVFATILFDMALFGTDNVIINGIISLFTSIQNSWDRSFVNEDIASTKVTDFCNRLNIQQEPWIWEKRKEEYTSLNDFFSRTYDSKYFPPIGSGRLVSPACCTIQCYNNDSDMKTVLIKGCDYEIGKIGLPEDDLEKYRMNKILIGYLSPKDYHRVHSPISGEVVHCKMEGINAPSASVKFFEGQFNLLNNNKRLVIVIEEKDDDDGSIDPLRVAIAIIGGVGVNTITYGDIMGKEVKKGDELSTFRAGGSAFALFSTKALDFVKPLAKTAEDDVHLETLIGETLVS